LLSSPAQLPAEMIIETSLAGSRGATRQPKR
jgi:hypothetical protein